jgi:flagellar hook protein FlgE
MGIQSSLYTGVSGLNANGNAMTVLGNNIANSNTIGFKSSRSVFSDMLSASVSGSGGTSQVGRGVGLSSVDNIFSQGTFENTESNTDLAIEGPGFFMVSDPETGTTNYTRAGAFNFNEEGTLVNPEGFAVQGYYLDEQTGETMGDVTDLQIETKTFAPAKKTETVNLMTNLNANAPFLGGYVIDNTTTSPSSFDIQDPSGTSNYASSVRIFDSLGREHLVTTYFNKLDPEGNPDGYMQWESHTVVSGAEIEGWETSASEWAEVGRSVLTFDTGGRLVNVNDVSETIYSGLSRDATTGEIVGYTPNFPSDATWQPSPVTDTNVNNMADYREYNSKGDLYVAETAGNYPKPTDVEKVDAALTPEVSTLDGALAWNNESDSGQQLNFNFGATQYSSESDVISQSQDGYATGTLVSLSIDGDGNILGNYSNGEPRKLARIALAKFSNPLGLTKVGNNLYEATDESGTAVIGTVGSGVGKIFTNSLEMSNVDLAQEFVKMITTQRGFQANSKIITTTDELLGELINLKR